MSSCSMRTFLLTLCSFLFFSLSSTVHVAESVDISQPIIDLIHQACIATLNQDVCTSMVLATGQVGPGATTLNVVQAALSASTDHLVASQIMVQDILTTSILNGDNTTSSVAQSCLEGLQKSQNRQMTVKTAIDNSKLKDARTWVSASLSHQASCLSEFSTVIYSNAVGSAVSFFNNTLIVSTGNVLYMLWALDVLGPDTAVWSQPRTERDGLWEPYAPSAPTEPQFDFGGLPINITVRKNGYMGCFTSIQEAVNVAPENLDVGNRFVIKIMEGVYEENVKVAYKKTNLVFLGDGIGRTIITSSLSVGLQNLTTFDTATVGVLGDGFMANGLTIQNTAGPNAYQAVAFRLGSDLSFIENCEFIGNQDTLYAHSLRQIYKSCRILGNIDYIFGNAAAVFLNCTILITPRQLFPEQGKKNTITAQGRTDPAQNTGFVFLNCLINGTDEYMGMYRTNPSVYLNYLGRPWKMYSRTVFIRSSMENVITPAGWMPWDGDFALNTLYYGEFGNTGLGADLSFRVGWASRIPEERVSAYDPHNFLQGDSWTTMRF